MAFYDGLGEKIQQTGRDAIDKTKKGTETLRLNNTISGLEKEINSEYTEVGKILYQKHATDEQDPDLLPHFQSIREKMATIEDCKEQIRKLKGTRTCINCGKEISETAVFCNYCGTKQVPENMASASEGVCPTCGAPIQGDQSFCTECGTRIEATNLEKDTQRRCKQCGEVLEADAVFCPNCGAKNDEPSTTAAKNVPPEPETAAPNLNATHKPSDSEPKSAAESGGNEMRVCVNCGEPLEADDTFCTNCGQRVEK